MHPDVVFGTLSSVRPSASRSRGSGVNDVVRASLSDLVALLGGRPADGQGMGVPVALRAIKEGAALLVEGADSNALYIVRSGSLKSFRTLEDGYEQVLALSHVGELLGAEALHGGHQPASVVALEDSTAYVLPVRDLPALRKQDPQLDLVLQLALSRQLVRAAETTAMAAPVASEVRLARFLLWLSGRMRDIGQSPTRLLLRMCRREIASLICVAHETVSRSFKTLADEGYLRVDRREVQIIDLDRLGELARRTRGLPQEVFSANKSVPEIRGTAWFPAAPPLDALAA